MNEVWLNLYLNKNDLDRLGMTEATALSRADLASDFEIVIGGSRFDWVCIQQGIPTRYVTDPGEALPEIVVHMRNKIWETVRITSPYRKPYVYRCPANERRARLPQMLAVYLFMYFLSSVTRYSPGYYEHLLESDYGPLVSTFISESPTQFLYLMASDILGREVSKPAIF
jgi:hypothetical protein